MTALGGVFAALLLSTFSAPERWSLATGAQTRCATAAEVREYRQLFGFWPEAWTLIVNGTATEVALSPQVCAALLRPAHPLERVYATWVLAHERQHVRGELDEDAADCGAARDFARVARLAGYSFERRWLRAFFRGDRCHQSATRRNG